MRKRFTAFCIFGLLIAAVAVTAFFSAIAEGQEESARTNPHDFLSKNYCGVCHREDMPKLTNDPVSTCTKCHQGNMVDHPVQRHPLGKKPGINLPGMLPLSAGGEIVCHTCHDNHNTSKFSKMLRVDFFRLCVSCHVGY